jgi:D-arabinose 1-dehydrogenase-like Zn-dependent alcohol dehydrogenase
MTKNLVAQVAKAKGEFELVERDLPEPAAGEVRIKVEACGVCFSDHLVKDGLWPEIKYPRIPGHEVAGMIDAVGPEVTEWKKGERVGVGWHGGHCFVCESCRRGDFMTCAKEQITGVTRDGGYAQYMIARHEAVARLPEGLGTAEAGPLLCAGITTFNALRHSGAKMGDLVGVLGLGGLGHFGDSVCGKGRIPDRGNRAWARKRRPCEETRSHRVHRQQGNECGAGVAEPWRSESDPGDRAECEGDRGCARRIGGGRQIVDCWRAV